MGLRSEAIEDPFVYLSAALTYRELNSHTIL
jgi:hypothetical protein